MNRLARALTLLWVTCAFVLAIGASSAFAVTLTPTTAPLPGSNFQGGDGNQDNPNADVGGGALPMGTPDGVTDVDWQSIPNAPGAADATQPFGDQAFEGGDKESEPGNWGLQFEGAGVNPSKDNLLAAWSSSASSVSGPPSTFLNLAFTREAQTGNTFITFELNQLTTSWNNGITTIPCRITGDILVSYEIASGGSPPNVDVIVYRWITDTSETTTGNNCAKTGHFQQLDPQPYAEAGVNASDITNYLTAGGLGNTFAEGTFGETSLNLTGILNAVNADICTNFGQVGMHTRSSTSIDSQLQDYITPVPVLVRSCKLKLDKKVSVNDPAGPYSDGPVNAHVGDTLYYKIAVQNTGSQPLEVTTNDTKCGDTLYSTPTGTTPLTMPQTIQPGATGTYYCRHTVAAADGPDYVNQACTSGVTTTGSSAQGDPDASALCDTVTVHVYDPHLKLDKKQSLTSGGTYVDSNLDVHLGDTVWYKLVVRNTGNVSLPVTTLDPPASETGCDGPLQDAATGGSDVSMPDTIAAGDSKTYYCQHVVVDADGNSFTNHACTAGKDSTGQDATALAGDSLCDTTTVTILKPHLKIDKTQSATSSGTYGDGALDVHVGDTVWYKLVVTNTGNTSLDVTTLDPPASETGCDGPLQTAATGGSDVSLPDTIAAGGSATYYCTHLIADGDGNSFTNHACTSGKDSTGTDATPKSGDALCDEVTVNILKPSLKIDKTQSATEGSGYDDASLDVHVGDTVFYKLVVTNTGNTSLDVTTLDPPAAQTGCDGPLTSTPGGSAVSLPDTIAAGNSATYYCTHLIADGDGNSFTNHACTSGTDSSHTVAGTLPGDSLCDTTTVQILKPKLKIDKQQSLTTDGNGFTDSNLNVHLGDKVIYKLVVSNTGNTSLDVTTLDPPASVTGCDGALRTTINGSTTVSMPDTIAAGDSKTYYCDHTIVDTDGTSFTNHACTSGTDRSDTAAAGDPNAAALCDEVTVDVLKPAIHVVKSGTPTTAHDGDKVVYSYVVTNPGNTPLGDVHVVDDKCSPTVYDSGDTNNDQLLDLNETWLYHCDYTVKHGDENSSHDIVNTVVADGTDKDGTKVTDDDNWTTHIVHPGIDVRKSRTEASVHVGDTIHYTVEIENTGDVALTVKPSDVNCDSFDDSSFTLAAGATETLHCTHVAGAADGDHYDNKACADGDDGAGVTVTDCDTVTTEIIHPAIHVVKSGTPTTAHDSQHVAYSYDVTIPAGGDTPLSNVGVTDDKCSPVEPVESGGHNVGDTNGNDKLDLDETWKFTCDYTVKHSDENESHDVVNTATASGTDKLGETVTDDDNWTTHIVHPALAIDKKQRVAGDESYGDDPITVYVGDTIEYEIDVTNPGDTPMDLTDFSDPKCDSAPTGPSGDTNDNQRLDTSETWVYHCSHVVGAEDETPWVNTATATAHDTFGGDDITKSDDVTANIVNLSISGLKFEDQNANGQRDAGEPTIADWTIYLDANDNGKLDSGETSTKTDSNGAFTFGGLDPGNYVVREDIPSGWHCSTPSPCEYGLSLKSRDPDKTGVDFGNWHDATLTGTKFHDRDGDGAARESGEEGLAGWTFYVDYNGNGVKDSGEPEGTSATDGSYKIDGIKPGTFAVREVGQAGWTCSFPASCEYDLTFKSNDAKTGADFGNWEPASVSGSKFQDTNNNGVHDAGEGPLQGFTFYVDYNGNGALDAGEPAAVSAADGTWTITGIEPGTFNVLKVADPNFTCSFPGAGDACKYQVSLQAGDAQTGKEFGNAPPAQVLLPERITPGNAKLLGPTGCVSKTFSARIRGSKVQSVTFVLDGKTIKRFTKTNKSGLYTVRINPKNMRIGVHRLVVSVTFQKGTGTNPKKMRLSFQRCAKKLAAPRFTG